jgi:hypothetical protein
MRLALKEAGDLVGSVLNVVVVLHQHRRVIRNSRTQIVDDAVVILYVAHACHVVPISSRSSVD